VWRDQLLSRGRPAHRLFGRWVQDKLALELAEAEACCEEEWSAKKQLQRSSAAERRRHASEKEGLEAELARTRLQLEDATPYVIAATQRRPAAA
jgi:hypothetical protein